MPVRHRGGALKWRSPAASRRMACMVKHTRGPKTLLHLPDLEQSKSMVLNSRQSPSSQHSYDQFASSSTRLCHDGGGKLDQIQFLLGHVRVQTTERYIECKQGLMNVVNNSIGLEPEAETEP